jgi:hypothetical protein
VLAARVGGFSPRACLAAGVCILIMASCIAEVPSRFEVSKTHRRSFHVRPRV